MNTVPGDRFERSRSFRFDFRELGTPLWGDRAAPDVVRVLRNLHLLVFLDLQKTHGRSMTELAALPTSSPVTPWLKVRALLSHTFSKVFLTEPRHDVRWCEYCRLEQKRQATQVLDHIPLHLQHSVWQHKSLSRVYVHLGSVTPEAARVGRALAQMSRVLTPSPSDRQMLLTAWTAQQELLTVLNTVDRGASVIWFVASDGWVSPGLADVARSVPETVTLTIVRVETTTTEDPFHLPFRWSDRAGGWQRVRGTASVKARVFHVGWPGTTDFHRFLLDRRCRVTLSELVRVGDAQLHASQPVEESYFSLS